MVIAARGDEQQVARRAPAGDAARLGDDLEPEQVDVEAAHAIDVRGAQVDVPDVGTRIDGPEGWRAHADERSVTS
jgi:hypothetical protein